MIVWVTRMDTCSWIWKTKPCPIADMVPDDVINTHNSDFIRLYGFVPEKGSCSQYELTLTPVGDKS